MGTLSNTIDSHGRVILGRKVPEPIYHFKAYKAKNDVEMFYFYGRN